MLVVDVAGRGTQCRVSIDDVPDFLEEAAIANVGEVIVIAGGIDMDAGILASPAVFRIDSHTLTLTGATLLNRGRYGHTMTPVKNGRDKCLLVCGGFDEDDTALDTCEMACDGTAYSTWTLTARMPRAVGRPAAATFSGAMNKPHVFDGDDVLIYTTTTDRWVTRRASGARPAAEADGAQRLVSYLLVRRVATSHHCHSDGAAVDELGARVRHGR